VVEVGVEPGVGSVAKGASCREPICDVARIGGSLEVGDVARVALGRHRLKLAAGGAFVTRVAIDGRVRPGQREAVVVLLDLLHIHLPALDRMALFAIGSELAPVDVSVAVLTALADVRKNRLDVALDARHRLVHAAQRILGLVVIEFRNRPNRLPCTDRVAILAGNVQVPVWAMRALGNLRPARQSARCQTQDYPQSVHAPRRPHWTRPLQWSLELKKDGRS